MKRESVNKTVLLLIVLFISAIFFSMIYHFLMAIVMAGIFSALMHPLYNRFLAWFRGKRSIASLVTLFVIVFLVIIPLSALLGIVTSQAFNVAKSVTPWVQERLTNPMAFNELLHKFPKEDT